MSAVKNSCYRFGPFLLEPKERLLLCDGRQITLTPKAFELLVLLVENSGHALTKEEMLTKLWPDTFVEEANLTNNISLLRRTLGDNSEAPQYIQTVPRLGYRFVATVDRVEAVKRSQNKRLALSVRSLGILLTLTITVALVLLITSAWVIRARHSRGALTSLSFRERDWVLITNFDNRTGEQLFDGTVESALERELSNSRFVNVISQERSADVLRLMNKPHDTKIDAAMGREICLRDGGIRAMLVGRVEKLGTTYVMSVSLVDSAADRTVASTSEEAPNQESIWPAIRRLSGWVRSTLGEGLPSIQSNNAALERVTTPSLRALQLYSQAMPLVNQGQSAPAEQVLREALKEDPEFPSANIMLAHMLKNQEKPETEWGPPSQRAFDLADRTTERERYFIEGSYYSIREQHEKAVSIYEALVQQYPDHFWGRNNLSWEYFYLGRWEESVTQLERAAELRPNDFAMNQLAASCVMYKDMAEARNLAQHAATLITPDIVAAHPWQVAWIRVFPVHDLWVRGEIEQALKELDRLAETLDSAESPLTGIVGSEYLSFGKLRRAEEIFGKLSETNVHRYTLLAQVAFLADDRTKFRMLISKSRRSPGYAIFFAHAGLTDEANKILVEYSKSQNSKTAPGRNSLKILKAEIALSRGRNNEAIPLLQEALLPSRWDSGFGFFMGSESLAKAFERQGDLQNSIRVLERASREKAIGFDNFPAGVAYWLRVQSQLARLYRQVGRVEDALKIESELSKLLAYADPDHPILRQLKESTATGTR